MHKIFTYIEKVLYFNFVMYVFHRINKNMIPEDVNSILTKYRILRFNYVHKKVRNILVIKTDIEFYFSTK